MFNTLNKELLCKEMDGINSLINKEDALFWANVNRGIKEGYKYSLEELAKHYSLSAFEKKVLLFFLYLEFCHISENLCFENELLSIFDTKDSLISRMHNSRYFAKESSLVKNDLISKECKTTGRSTIAEYALSAKTRSLVSEMLSGQTIDWDKNDNRKSILGFGKVA